MHPRTASRRRTLTRAGGVVGALTVAGTLAACSSSSEPAADAAAPAPAASTSGTGTPGEGASGSAAGSTYRDGTYSAEGTYTSPGGQEHVKVEVTLADDVVTAVTVTPESTNPNGKHYQELFASGVAGQVVGKDVDDVAVTKVSGSSLTSQGFMAALAAIEDQARA